MTILARTIASVAIVAGLFAAEATAIYVSERPYIAGWAALVAILAGAAAIIFETAKPR